MEQITSFKASDGEVFTTSEACENHERLNCGSFSFDEYIKSDFNPYQPSNSTTSMSRKIINGWGQYKKSKEKEPEITTDISSTKKSKKQKKDKK